MSKFERLVGSDLAGPLKDLPLDKAGADQDGTASSTGAAVRSDLPLFKVDERGVELAGQGVHSADSNEVRSGVGRRSQGSSPSHSKVGQSGALPFGNLTNRMTEFGTVAASRTPKRAGTAFRLGAGSVDLLIITGIDAVVLLLTSRLAGVGFDAQVSAALVAPPLLSFLFMLNLAYVLTLTRLSGQTLGKMLFGIRVVNNSGGMASTRQIIIRTFGWLISILLLGIGFLFLCFGKKRGLHDLAAGTDVVHF